MRTIAILAAAAAFLIPATASAQAALRVQPLSVDVASPSQASSVRLQNSCNEVIASAPVARIAPGSNYTIRIARTVGAAAPGTEESYRLWVDELPPASLARTEGGTVDVRLRFDLPVFFRGEGTSPSLGWNAQQ